MERIPSYYLDTYIYHGLDRFPFALCVLIYEPEARKYVMSCFYFPENPSAFPFEHPSLKVDVFHLPPITTYTFDSVLTGRSCSHLITTGEDFLSCLNMSSLLCFLKFNSSLLKSCYITYFFLQYEVTTKNIIEELMAVFNWIKTAGRFLNVICCPLLYFFSQLYTEMSMWVQVTVL